MRGRLVIGGAVVAALVAVAVAAVVVRDDATAPGVRLEPIDAAFETDFAANLDLLRPGSSIAIALADVPPIGSAIAAALRGDEPGLYGGSRRVGTCDVDALVEFLTDPANRAKAQAWAAALGIRRSEIAEFVAGLTPVRLRFDTRVTNHGFVDGRANPIPAVLEAGTAVLVDERGVPRVKCNCGNPLAPPGTETRIADRGVAWAGFDAERVVKVEAGEALEEFVLVDVDDGTLFTRPVGTNGEADAPVPAGGPLCDRFAESPTCDGRGTASDVTMPDVVGSSVAAARSALAALGFVLDPTIVEEPSDDVPPGTVLASEPPAGRTVPVKSPVTLVVAGGPAGEPASTSTSVAPASTSNSSTSTSSSTSSTTTTTTPPRVTVPDVVGMPESQAVATIQDAGLVAQREPDFGGSGQPGTVSSQDPPGGTQVPPGSTVLIRVVEVIG